MSPSIILRATTTLLLPLLLMFALLLLLRGHHEPGGGFVAGLTAAGGFALYRMAHGAVPFVRIIRVAPSTVVAIGLALSLGASLLPWITGQTFFQAAWRTVGNGFGTLSLGTPIVFDVGVAAAVVGFALLAFDALEDGDD